MEDLVQSGIPAVNPMEDPEIMYDPAHQAKLYMIEEAYRKLGKMKSPESISPKYYDDMLMKLINAVPI